MKFIVCFLLITSHVFAATSEEKKLFGIKVLFEQKAHELKLLEEQELIRARGKTSFELSQKAFDWSLDDQSCVEWVYQGPASREDAARACRGVRGTECLNWVYQGPASRIESAEACSGVVEQECLNWVYQGPASRLEAARACNGVTDMECVRWVYQGSASRVEAAQSCQGGRRHPRRPGDC